MKKETTMKLEDRRYNVVAINERTGEKTVVSGYPLTHAEAANNAKRFSYYPLRRIQLEEIPGGAA